MYYVLAFLAGFVVAWFARPLLADDAGEEVKPDVNPSIDGGPRERA